MYSGDDTTLSAYQLVVNGLSVGIDGNGLFHCGIRIGRNAMDMAIFVTIAHESLYEDPHKPPCYRTSRKRQHPGDQDVYRVRDEWDEV